MVEPTAVREFSCAAPLRQENPLWCGNCQAPHSCVQKAHAWWNSLLGWKLLGVQARLGEQHLFHPYPEVYKAMHTHTQHTTAINRGSLTFAALASPCFCLLGTHPHPPQRWTSLLCLMMQPCVCYYYLQHQAHHHGETTSISVRRAYA